MDQAQEEENNWVRAAAILSFIKLNSLLPVTTAAVWTPIERQKLLFGNATGRGHKNRICKDLWSVYVIIIMVIFYHTFNSVHHMKKWKCFETFSYWYVGIKKVLLFGEVVGS